MTPHDSEPALFEVHDPPPGGAAAFRRRIVAERKKHARRRRVVAGGAIVAIVAIALVATLGPPFASRRPAVAELDFSLARMRLGTLTVPASAVTIADAARGDTAALQLPSTDERIVLYLVASRAPVAVDATGEPPRPDRDGT